MQRCLELGQLGAGHVAPNPMVGAVLVHGDRVIGEGWHREYGKAHAEVNCIESVKNEDKGLISQSTLYVSLEPCSHFGKTPPCADLIIKNKIPKVVIGSADPFIEVDGKGIEKLRAAGVEVEMAETALQTECKNLNKRFFTFHTAQRPYIVLKWAETADGFIARLNQQQDDGSGTGNRRLLISNAYSNRLVHQWRSEEAAILVGTNTALLDDPELTNRLWQGSTPIRLVLDLNLRLPQQLRIFDGKGITIVLNSIKNTVPDGIKGSQLKQHSGVWYSQIDPAASVVQGIMKALYRLEIQSVLVEGGAYLLRSFLDEGAWDEARVITNRQLVFASVTKQDKGLSSPSLHNAMVISEQEMDSDAIKIYMPAVNGA